MSFAPFFNGLLDKELGFGSPKMHKRRTPSLQASAAFDKFEECYCDDCGQ